MSFEENIYNLLSQAVGFVFVTGIFMAAVGVFGVLIFKKMFDRLTAIEVRLKQMPCSDKGKDVIEDEGESEDGTGHENIVKSRSG